MTNGPIALCYGTRPQVIKASRIAAALARRDEVITVDTGQHYDYEMDALLYEQLGVRKPDVVLGVGSSDHATQTAAILLGSAKVFRERTPSMVVVIGDTNSTLGCALAAVQMAIPVVHIEAGLRSGNLAMAEEVNRRIVDSVSSLLCAPSARAAQRLRAEGVPGVIATTGDVARDVLLGQLGRAGSVRPLDPSLGGRYCYATLHRAELTADAATFGDVLRSLGRIAMPVVLPMHPRTRASVERMGLIDAIPANVRVSKPFGYLQSLASIRDASVVVTDSGGVQREAYWLGTPCVTLRNETEWTETVELGANRLVPPEDADMSLLAAIEEAIVAPRDWNRDAYGSGHAADAICDALQDAGLSARAARRIVV